MAMQFLTSIDGKISAPDVAVIPVDDMAVLRGDGAFEVLRVYDGVPFALADHLNRLEHSCAAIELDFSRADLEREIEALLKAAGATGCLLRLVITRGGRRLAILEELIEHGDSIGLFPVTYSPSGVLTGVKSLSYAANMQATRIAKNAGFGEALLVRPDGVVLEAPTSTIFWAAGDKLKTPSLEAGILASITRRILVDALEVEQGEFQLADLERADEAFLASTTREVQPIDRVAAHEFEIRGPVTAEAAAIVRAAIEPLPDPSTAA